MKVFLARAGLAAALSLALVGAARSAERGGDQVRRTGAAAAGREFQGADLDRGGQAGLFRQGAKGDYSGNVVVIQGDSEMTSSAMTIFMEKNPEPAKPDAAKAGDRTKAADTAKAADAAAAGRGTSHVRHLDAVGPVTVVSKTQVATGDSASYDKAQNKVWLIGNVTLSDGGNVTKGDKLTYDMTTGQATVDTGPAAKRVKGLFIPGSGTPAAMTRPKPQK